MAKYKAIVTYTVVSELVIEADHEEDAEDMAWSTAVRDYHLEGQLDFLDGSLDVLGVEEYDEITSTSPLDEAERLCGF